jgi:hypothetical protein
MALHPDSSDLLAAFAAAEVQYLIVGGYAVEFHARPRFTGRAPKAGLRACGRGR